MAESSHLVYQHEVNNNNYSAKGSKMYICVSGTSNSKGTSGRKTS